jgi:2-hydroxychromene-2-carboxylate isomerase
MPNPIEFYFDFSSPYAYLASELIDDLAKKYERKVQWRPIMLGAPYFIVDDEPFWGADRLPQIEKWLQSGGF